MTRTIAELPPFTGAFPLAQVLVLMVIGLAVSAVPAWWLRGGAAFAVTHLTTMYYWFAPLELYLWSFASTHPELVKIAPGLRLIVVWITAEAFAVVIRAGIRVWQSTSGALTIPPK